MTVPAVCLTGVASPGGYCAVPCTLPGTQDDCPVNSLCTAFAGGSFCARICQNQSECRTGYTCNGVTGSNVKTCQ